MTIWLPSYLKRYDDVQKLIFSGCTEFCQEDVKFYQRSNSSFEASGVGIPPSELWVMINPRPVLPAF